MTDLAVRAPTRPACTPRTFPLTVRARAPKQRVEDLLDGDLQTTFLLMADSIGEGANAVTRATRWSHLVQEDQRTDHPKGFTQGTGCLESLYAVSTIPDPTTSGNVTVDGQHGIGYRSYILGPTTGSGIGKVTYTGVTASCIRVWYTTITLAGTLEVVVDGGTPVPIATSSQTLAFHSDFTDVPVSPGSHTIVVQWRSTGTGFLPNPSFNLIQVFNDEQPADAWAVLDGVNGYLSTPDFAWASSDREIRYEITPTGYDQDQVICAQWDDLFGNERSFIVRLDSDMRPTFSWSSAGTAVTGTFTSAAAHSARHIRGRIRFDADNGAGGKTIIFEESDDFTDPLKTTATWDALDTQSPAGTTSIFNATSSVELGRRVSANPQYFGGTLHDLVLFDGLTGTVAARLPTGVSARSKPGFDDAGRVWSAVGGCRLDRSGERGVHWLNAARSGAGVSLFPFIDEFVPDWVAESKATVAVIHLGVNDRRGNVVPETYEAGLQTIIDLARQRRPSVAVGLIVNYEAADAFSLAAHYPWSDYVDAMYRIVEANERCEIIVDLSDPAVFPQPGTPEGISSGYWVDQLHPETSGHAAMATVIGAAIEDLTFDNPSRCRLAGTNQRPRVEFDLNEWETAVTVPTSTAQASAVLTESGGTLTTETNDALITET